VFLIARSPSASDRLIMQSDQKHWGIERLETLGDRAIRNTGKSSDQKHWGIERSKTPGD